jgi:hypothetical protein
MRAMLKQGEGDDEIEEAPQEIHDRAGEAPARRPRERAGERLPAQSAHEMRDGVAQESAGEEIGHELEKDGGHHTGDVSLLAVRAAGYSPFLFG